MALATYMIESWSEFAIGVLIILLRIIARTKIVGLGGWHGDDYLIIFALGNYILQLVMHQGIYENGMNWALTDDFIAKMSDEEVHRREIGSRDNFIAWIAYLNLIWGLKFCMLFLYWRLASSLDQKRRLVICAAFIFTTYIGSWLVLCFHCTPIQKNWQVRPNPGKCSFELPLFYAIGPLNIITDIVLLFIPIPLIKKARLTLTRKFLVGVLLCGGIFTIVATLLNNLFSLLYTLDNMSGLLNHKLSHPNSDAGWILGWGVRETFTAVIVVNAPCIKPLFSRTAWIKKNSEIVERGSHSNSNRSDPENNPADVQTQFSTFQLDHNDTSNPDNSTDHLAPELVTTGVIAERKSSDYDGQLYDEDAPAYELAVSRRSSGVGGMSFDLTAKERYSGISSNCGAAI